ncbi:MAG: pirin family protein [Polyangiaceae bacterium]|nr:pirin family protein [Polyangiaceae bacterium]
MITIRRANERHHDLRGSRELWLTFHPNAPTTPLADGFGALEMLNESRLPPDTEIPPRVRHDIQIITYVREGALAYEDSMGRLGVLRAGEFHHMSFGRGIRHSDKNASRTDWAHVFQIWLRPTAAGLDSRREQRRFSAADRRGRLRVIASPDARNGSLQIHQDTLICSALLEPGQHVAHEIHPGRSVWLHLVHGEVGLDEFVLTTGDGVGVSAERAVSVTARAATEILLLDLDSMEAAVRLQHSDRASPDMRRQPSVACGEPSQRS